jgi:hypothetical protein
MEGIGHQLAAKEAKLVSSLPKEVVPYPWTPRLVQVLCEGGPLEERPIYGENQDSRGKYRPTWGEFLTRAPISEACLAAVLEVHKKLLSYAEKFLPQLQEQRGRLKELGDLIVDELDVFLMKRLVPGRCRYCPF